MTPAATHSSLILGLCSALVLCGANGACGPDGGPPLPDAGNMDAGPDPDPIDLRSEPFEPTPPVVGDDIVPAIGALPSLPGAIDVTSTGEAVYEIPLPVPQGHPLATPEATVSYASRGGDGPMGLGWSLHLAREIARCPSYNEVSGSASPVRLQASDPLCLDGEPLRLAAGVQGMDGAVYELETDFRVRVVQSGRNTTARFVVTSGDGQIEYFGGPNATVVATPQREIRSPEAPEMAMVWSLASRVDPRGNRIDYTYVVESEAASATVEQRLTSVAYGGQSSNTHTRFIDIVWTPRPSPLTRFESGVGFRNSQIIESIDTRYMSRLATSYRFGYEFAGRARVPRITSVRGCDSGRFRGWSGIGVLIG